MPHFTHNLDENHRQKERWSVAGVMLYYCCFSSTLERLNFVFIRNINAKAFFKLINIWVGIIGLKRLTRVLRYWRRSSHVTPHPNGPELINYTLLTCEYADAGAQNSQRRRKCEISPKAMHTCNFKSLFETESLKIFFLLSLSLFNYFPSSSLSKENDGERRNLSVNSLFMAWFFSGC